MYCLKVKEVRVFEKAKVVSLRFDRELRGYPGQFVMLNVFGFEEIPVSLSSPDSLTIKAVGETTKALLRTEKGKIFGIRGPFGRPFSLPSKDEKPYLVAGGIGIAPLNYLYQYLKDLKWREVTVIHGIRTADELIFDYPEIATDDGSCGFKGNSVQLLMKIIDTTEPFRIYACGPKPMLLSLYKEMKKIGKLKSVEFSLENYMRCGIGICGSCVTNKGLRVCADGPVFNGNEIDERDLKIEF
ncbi:MAG: dihydroorotate dehydrogenase [Archaeoglobus sp.]|jgi:dihydroorotate dehydrogenase electron transfer subunit|nr:MAG: dihydroorotate dehydrogenase [Archaeoglobus sp.]